MFGVSTVSAAPQVYMIFNADGTNNCAWNIQPINGTAYITPSQALWNNLPLTANNPNVNNDVFYYTINFISKASDYTFISAEVVGRVGTGSGSIWKWLVQGTYQSTNAITSIQIAVSNVTGTSSSYAELSTSSALTY